MKKNLVLKKIRYGLLGTLIFFGCMVATFYSALPIYSALVAPDSMPFFAYHFPSHMLETILVNANVTPQSLYWIFLNPLVAHEMTYMVDSFVLALGVVYYLRGRRVHPLAAWLGGVALGLSGYTFTLFCAGHRGYFHMFSCAIWLFGLILRGFQTKRLFYFAMIGLVLAWGVSYQPDVLLLMGILAGFYVLWLTVRETGAADGPACQLRSEMGN